MKKTILYIIFTLTGIVGVYSDSELGTINDDYYTFKMERTADNASPSYYFGFTLKKNYTITIKDALSGLTIRGYQLNSGPLVKISWNTPTILSAGYYQLSFTTGRKAFRLEITFAAESSTGITVVTNPTTPPKNVTPNGGNYIKTATPLTGKDNVTFNPDSSEIVSFQYFDGLGRPVEIVQHKFTPAKKDLVTLQEYDEFGRASYSWLPTPTTKTTGAFINNIASSAKTAYGNDDCAYSKPVYEASPLNRVLEQFGPGADWQNNGKSVKTGYSANIAKTGTAWVDADSLVCGRYLTTDDKKTISIYRTDNYAANELYVTRTIDEDGNVSYEFKNKLGQVVLTRQINAKKSISTNYVYDSYGNLRAILPPEASTKLLSATSGAPWTETNSDLKLYAYLYKYDNRNRCIAKKLPGCDWVYYIYDKADHLVFTQDGENRKAGVWQFAIPDAIDRTVLTGTCKNTYSYVNDTLGTKVVKGVYNTARTNLANYYTISGVTLKTPVILAANFYDNYSFLGITEIPNSANTQYVAESGYGACYGDHKEANAPKSKGLLTGTVTAQMNADGTISSTYLYSVMYYDNRERIVQTKSNNPLAGGVEKEYVAYNFTGQPLQKKHVHSATGKTTQTEVYVYTYDHAGRLTKETHQLNTGTAAVVAANTYDEMGRLKTNKKGGQANLNATYAYNIRSWIKSITIPLFTETLYYNEAYGGSAKRYNGNIGAMTWKLSSETGARGYTFTYDNLSRLTAANYMESDTTNTHYKVTYTYDNQGNMLTLKRYGKTKASTYGLIDNLTLSYTGNQLLKAEDAVANISLAESADFKNYSNVATEYTYNTNGAMNKDLNSYSERKILKNKVLKIKLI